MLMPSGRADAPFVDAGDDEQHADEREHEADRPANIESHKFIFGLVVLVYQKMMFRMTQPISSTMPTTAGRSRKCVFVVLDFGRERIDQAFQFFVGFGARWWPAKSPASG